jgi:hypothetical protein
LSMARPFLMPQELPAAIRSLEPHQAEDFLCVFKSKFGCAESKPGRGCH